MPSIPKSEYFSEVTNQQVYIIDSDGDSFNTFQKCVEYLNNNKNITTIKKQLGYFDTAHLIFEYQKNIMYLEYSNYTGTELRSNKNPTESEIKTTNNLAQELREISA